MRFGHIPMFGHAHPPPLFQLPTHPVYCACSATPEHPRSKPPTRHPLAKAPFLSLVAIAPAPIGTQLWTNWEPETRTHSQRTRLLRQMQFRFSRSPRSIDSWRAGTKAVPRQFCARCSRPFPMSCRCESFHHKHHKTKTTSQPVNLSSLQRWLPKSSSLLIRHH